MLEKITQAIQCVLIETASSISRIITEPLYWIHNLSSGFDQIFKQDDDEDDDDDFDTQPAVVVKGFAN